MYKLRFIIGFAWFAFFGNGAGRPLWQAISLYTHRYIYLANKPYSYKRIKDSWNMETIR